MFWVSLAFILASIGRGVFGYTGSYLDDFEESSNDFNITGIPEFDEIMQSLSECSGARFDFDSCIAQTSFDLVFHADNAITDILLGCFNGTGFCDIPMNLTNLTEDLLAMVLDDVIVECADEINSEELDDFVGNFTLLMEDETCWSPLLAFGDSFGNITGSLKGDLALSYVDQCTEAEIKWDSCTLRNTLGFIFATDVSNDPHFTSRKLNVPQINNHQCAFPHFSDDDLNFYVEQASLECEMSGESTTLMDIAETADSLGKIFSDNAEQCWIDVCSGEADLSMLSTWLGHCANIELPTHNVLETSDPMLPCMIEFAMNVELEDFGIPNESVNDPLNECMPAGYENMLSFCPSMLAPVAFDICQNITLSASHPSQEVSFPQSNDTPFPDISSLIESIANSNIESLQGSFSSSSAIYDNTGTLNSFCDIMIRVSSEEAKECVLPFCLAENNEVQYEANSDYPSSKPTSAPTLISSSRPSPSPSQVPSLRPSTAPSNLPTLLPSMTPSTSSGNCLHINRILSASVIIGAMTLF